MAHTGPVAFLGLGIMGEAMARNLLRAGYSLRVWNRTAAKADALVREGATLSRTPAEAAKGAEQVVMMVADPPALEEILGGPLGVMEGIKSGAMIINMGTQSIEQIEAIGGECRRRDIGFLDAPVTGSRNGAIQGTLTILVGGEEDVLERVRPLLAKMGKTILHLGGVGDGTRFKLVLNLIQAGMLTVWAEGISLGSRLGLPPEQTQRVIENSGADCPLFRFKSTSLLKGDLSPHFSLKLMDKDLKLCLAEAAAVGVGLPACQAVSSIFSAARAAGWGEADFLSIAKVVEQLAGARLFPPQE